MAIIEILYQSDTLEEAIMNKVTPKSIKPLLEPNDGAMVSLYFPTHRSPTSFHVQEDKIRCKNLLRASEEALINRGVEAEAARQITGRLEKSLYNDDDFWQHTTEGMAIFASSSETHYFHLPMECEERASAGDTYDIVPLLVLLSYDIPYYLLALAVHDPILYKGDMYGVEPVELALPASPEAALNIDELYSNSQTVRAGGGYGPGSPSSGSHGQGDSRQAGQGERLEFFRIIDDRIISSDQIDGTLPLLVAGSEGEVSDYKEQSRNKSMPEVSLSGNYTASSGFKPQEIHDRSWQIIERELGKGRRSHAVERFGELRGMGKSSTDLKNITACAEEGRIDTLLVGMLTVTRDTVSDGDEAMIKLIFPEGYEKAEITALGQSVFNQGGEIIGLLGEDMPGGAEVAALYRY